MLSITRAVTSSSRLTCTISSGKKIEDATVSSKAGSFDGAKDGYDYAGNYVDYTNMPCQLAGWNHVFVNAEAQRCRS